MLEVDVQLNFELANMRRKYVFNLSRLSICSQLQESVGNRFQIPQSSSVTSNDLSTPVISGDAAPGLLYGNVIHPLDDPSCSKDSETREKFNSKNCVPEISNLSHQKYILKRLGASVSVEGPLKASLSNNHAWVGSGCFYGFDITLSISEMKVSNVIFL